MYQKDYLLRYIEQLSKAVSRILNLKDSGNIEGAFERLEYHYQETLGLTPETAIGTFDPAGFLRYLETKFQPRARELEGLAQLVDAYARLCEAKGAWEDALHRHQVGYNLVKEAENLDPQTFSLERQHSLHYFMDRIQVLSHPY